MGVNYSSLRRICGQQRPRNQDNKICSRQTLWHGQLRGLSTSDKIQPVLEQTHHLTPKTRSWKLSEKSKVHTTVRTLRCYPPPLLASPIYTFSPAPTNASWSSLPVSTTNVLPVLWARACLPAVAPPASAKRMVRASRVSCRQLDVFPFSCKIGSRPYVNACQTRLFLLLL